MNRPYVKPAMLECRCHPGTGLWCREDGAVLVPAGGRGRKEQWTFGNKNSRTGYMAVGFRGRLYLVHRLIAESFLKNEFNLPTTDHINRIRDDNRPSNLRFASRKLQNDNRQVCEDSLARYGVRACENLKEYLRAYREKNPEYIERQRASARKWYAKNAERKRAKNRAYMQDRLAKDPEYAKRQLTNVREWQDRQRALGRLPRKCPDGKTHWLTDEEYDARCGQLRLF